MPIQLTAQHIAEQDGGFEPQRANNGQIIIFGVGGWNLPSGHLSLSIEAFDLPAFEGGVTELHWQGQVRKVIGNVRFNDIEVVVREFADKPTSQAVWAWVREVHNYDVNDGWQVFNFAQNLITNPASLVFGGGEPPPGGRGLARNYKKTGVILLTDPSGGNVRAYAAFGIFPYRWVPGRIDMESEEILKGTLHLSIDFIQYVPLGSIPDRFEDILELV